MDFGDTHHLGARAFIIFLAKHSKWPLIFLVVLVLLWTQRGFVPADYAIWTDFALKALLLMWLGLFAFVLFRSYFEYRGHSYRFDDEYFHVTNGYITRNEIGVVYHQIQHVTIKRGVFDRLIGVSHIIIVTNMVGNDPTISHITLPAINSNKARLIHRELLRKAQGNASAERSRDNRAEDSDDDEENDWE